jgi:hypothetical protein
MSKKQRGDARIADGASDVTEGVARRIETSPDRLCTGAFRNYRTDPVNCSIVAMG